MHKVLLPILSLLFIFICATGCLVDYEDDHFMFYNNSDGTVLVHLGVTDTTQGGSLYPDTGIMKINCARGLIEAKSFLTYDYARPPKTDTLCFFIFDADTINKYSWEEIRKGYKVLQRYNLIVTKEELKKLDYKIYYPPTENMKHIKMYPPYEE